MKYIVRLLILVGAVSAMGTASASAGTCQMNFSAVLHTPFSVQMATAYGQDNDYYSWSSYDCFNEASSEVYAVAYWACTTRSAAHTWSVWVDAYYNSAYVNSFFNYGNCNGINDYSTMTLGQSLNPDDTISSPNSSYTLYYQLDGNLVLYHGSSAVWSSVTNPSSPGQAIMQNDGNFVVYDSSSSPLWASGTNPSGAYLAIRNDGYIAVYSSTGVLLWRS